MPSCFITENNPYGFSSENKQHKLPLQVKWYWNKLNPSVQKDNTQNSGLQGPLDLVLIQTKPPVYQLGDLKWSLIFQICKMGINTVSQTSYED